MADAAIVEAVKKVLDSSPKRKFRESVDLAINLKEIDLSIPKNRIDEDVILPNGRGTDVRVAVFGSGELAMKAKAAADAVFEPAQLNDLAGKKREARRVASRFHFFIAEAPMMITIGKVLGKYLGPRGKMPRPIPQLADPAPLIGNLKKTVKIRSRDRRTFHAPVGTREMKPEAVAENIEAVLKRVEGKLARGRYNIAAAYIKTTMGSSVRIF